MERFFVKIERTYGELRKPQNTQTSEEVEPFSEVQRALVASPGPVPEIPLVSPASPPIEANCVGESASPLLCLKLQPGRLGDPRDKDDLLRASRILSCRNCFIRIRTS